MDSNSIYITLAIVFAMTTFISVGLNKYAAKSGKEMAEQSVIVEPEKRIELPLSGCIYMFKADFPLTKEEWEEIFSAGWDLVTCNNETYHTYIGRGPESPEVERTRWHYVFRKTGQIIE